MNKLAASVVTLLFASIAPPALHAEEFGDVPLDHKNRAAIHYLQEAGVIDGYADGTFQPENTVNRAELLKY